MKRRASAWIDRRDPLRLMMALLVSVNGIALGATGEVTLLAFGLPAVALFAVLRPRTRPLPRSAEIAFQLMSAAFLVYFVLCLMQLRVLAGAAAATIPGVVHSLLQPPTHRAMWRLQLLGFFQLVALAASTTKILFGPLLLVHMVIIPLAVTLAALERAGGLERRPLRLTRPLARASGIATAACLVGGALVFLALPRYEAGFLRELAARQQRMAGFSETVTLGDIGRIQTSTRPVMRVRFQGDAPASLRYRGIALDRFTGRAWSVTVSDLELVPNNAGPYDLSVPVAGSHRLVQEFTLEPMRERVLFHLPRVVSLTPGTFHGVLRDSAGNLARSGEVTRRVKYEVVSELGPDTRPISDAMRAACLQLPEMDAGVRELAESVAGSGTDAERAKRIEEHLRREHGYTLDVQDAGLTNPVETFLLERRAGHCEYFASGMAVMVRSLGVPARIVNGFQEGTPSRWLGGQLVRQSDAHSWVEVWIDGRGWTTFDPTPAIERVADGRSTAGLLELWQQAEIFWDDNVIGFSATSQIGLWLTLRDGLESLAARAGRHSTALAVTFALLGLAAVVASVVTTRIRGRRGARQRIAFFDVAVAHLKRRGHVRLPHETPAQLASRAGRAEPVIATAAAELMELYYAARFGGRRADPERVAKLLNVLAAPRVRSG